MRDPKRIKRILHLIEIIWLVCPDLRLGQLLYNFAGFKDESFYNTEDSITEEVLIKSLSRITVWEKKK